MNIRGKNAINETIRSHHKINVVYILDFEAKKNENFLAMLKDKSIKYQICSKEEMNSRFSANHQGYAADVEPYTYQELENVFNPNKKQVFLILDKLEDPQNLGSIIRSSDAFGIDGIIIPKNNSVSLTETVVRVSTGAINYVNIIEVNNLNKTIDYLKENFVKVIGTDALATKEVKDLTIDQSVAFVIGSEGFGMSKLTKEKCDDLVKIPMIGHVNSLNASVSAGIILALYQENFR